MDTGPPGKTCCCALPFLVWPISPWSFGYPFCVFIRRTITNSGKTDQAYHTYRLVEGVRRGHVVKQTKRFNLGSHFDLPQANWALLASRIDALKRGQEALQLAPVPEAVEAMAQCCAAQLITRQTKPMLGKLSAVQLMARSLQVDAAAAAATGLTCEDDRHSTIAAKQPPVVACPSRATS